MYSFVSLLVNINFLSSYFLALKTFQGFSLNFMNQTARTLGRAVEKLLNGSFTWAVYFGKAKSEFLSRQGKRTCKFSHFLDIVKTGLFFICFS